MENSPRLTGRYSESAFESKESNTVNSTDKEKTRKRKMIIQVEKIGHSDEYDESLLKRRKKKLQGKGITVALPK